MQLRWMGASALPLLMLISGPSATGGLPSATAWPLVTSSDSQPAVAVSSVEEDADTEEALEAEDHCERKATMMGAPLAAPRSGVLGFLREFFPDNQGPIDVWMVFLGMAFAGFRRLCQTKYAAIEPLVRVLF